MGTPILAEESEKNDPTKFNPNKKEKNENYKGPDFKELVDKYPNETPVQIKIKDAINIMKNGDPAKPKSNNGKKDPKDIPEFSSEVLSVEEIKKNGKVVGKTVHTKTVLTFKHKGQLDQTDEEWNSFGFNKNVIGEFDDELFKETCKQSNGKISKDGQYCDVKEMVKNDINSKLAKLNDKWMSDDFYLLEGGDLKEAKAEAKKRGVFPPSIQDNNGKKIGHKENDFFKGNSNPKGIDIDSQERKYEFIEKFTVDYSDAAENIPEDADLSNTPIIPSSYDFSSEDENILYDYFSTDFSELILPEAEAATEDISQFAMMGFTIAPPKLGWEITVAESVCFPIWYPTGLHITWGGFLGLEITHFHIHFAHQTICTEIVFFRVFANLNINAALRMPIEVIYKDVPDAVFPGNNFTIQTVVKPKDFTAQEYKDFCNNQDVKNDFFLQLSKLIGEDPCERFALESFWYDKSSVSGSGFDRLEFGTIQELVNGSPTGEKLPVDGNEFSIQFILGAGVELKFFNRTIDVCALAAEANLFSCVLGYNVDVGLSCTTGNLPQPTSAAGFLEYIEFFKLKYPHEFVQKLKEEGIHCSSFATPVGEFSPIPLGLELAIPAECTAVNEAEFPPSDKTVKQWLGDSATDKFSPAKFGPMDKSTDTPTKCKKPGPKCICTDGVLREIKLPGTEYRLGIGLGMNAGMNVKGGPVTADLSVGGATTEFTDTLVFNASKVSISDGEMFGDDSSCLDGSDKPLLGCNNFELPLLEFLGQRDNGAGDTEITITPTNASEYINVGLDEFSLSMQTFELYATPTIDITGSKFLTDIVGKIFGTKRFAIEPLTVSIPINAGTGIPIDQHARTAPVSISITVDTFGFIPPESKVVEGEGPLTLVNLGEPYINPTRNATEFDVQTNLDDVAPGGPNATSGFFPFSNTTVLWTVSQSDSGDDTKRIERVFEQIIGIIDTTPPEVFPPANVTNIEAEAFYTNVSIGFASATDVMDTEQTFSLFYNKSGLDDGTDLVEVDFPNILSDFISEFRVGNTTVTWNATDDTGNVGQGDHWIVVKDTTPPMITAPDDITEFIEGFQARILFGFPEILEDLVDDMPSIETSVEGAELAIICEDGTDLENVTAIENATCADMGEPMEVMSGLFTIGTTNVTWTAKDKYGNNRTDTQKVTATVPGDLSEPKNFIQDLLEVDEFPCGPDTIPCKFSYFPEIDCDDSNDEVFPGSTELVDGIDNDCDGVIDEGPPPAPDDDNDGFPADVDCNDNNDSVGPTVYPGAPELDDKVDNDCDGVIDEGVAIDKDSDGFPADVDCNDNNDSVGPTVYPGAPELADGLDNDCDRLIDEGPPPADNDGDGFAFDVDCDDKNDQVFPGATELDDGIDNDCDGQIDEGFPSDDDNDGFPASELGPRAFGEIIDRAGKEIAILLPKNSSSISIGVGPGNETAARINACEGLATIYLDPISQISLLCGSVTVTGISNDVFSEDVDNDSFKSNVDCNDNNDTVYPGAPELADGLDNDCDEVVDEGASPDDDKDGFPSDVDCNDNNDTVFPGAPEDKFIPGNATAMPPTEDIVPDGLDNDCDEMVDEGVPPLDDLEINGGDVDGFPSDVDCNNNSNSTYPGAPELFDGLDNDCDGVVDEGVSPDDDNDDFPLDVDCNDNNDTIFPGAREVDDEKDYDCDGVVFIPTKVEFNVGGDIATVFLPPSTAITYDDFFFDLLYSVGEDNMMEFLPPVTGTFKGEFFTLPEDGESFELDKIPPVIQTNDATLPATDPFGTIVNYDITTSDNLDPNPKLVCIPPSGSLFKMGNTTVNCTVVDTSKNFTPDTLDVTIFLARETFDGFNNIISNMDIQDNKKKSLTSLVTAAGESFEKGNPGTAINQLNAFKKIVGQGGGKNIPGPDKITLVEAADLVIAQLELLNSGIESSQTEISQFEKEILTTSSSDTTTDLPEPNPKGKK